MTTNRRLNNLYRVLHNEHGVGVLPKYSQFETPTSVAAPTVIGIIDIYDVRDIRFSADGTLAIQEVYFVGAMSPDEGIPWPLPTIRERLIFRDIHFVELDTQSPKEGANLALVDTYEIGAPPIIPRQETLVFVESYQITGEEEEPDPVISGIEYLIFEIDRTEETTDGYSESRQVPGNDVFIPLRGRNLRFKLQGSIFVLGDFRDFGQATISVDYYYSGEHTTEITYLTTYVFPIRSGLYADEHPHTGVWVDLGAIITNTTYYLPEDQSVEFLVRIDCADGASAVAGNIRFYGVV